MTDNEKKQIEEMAKVIEITEQIARDAHCGLPSPTMYAKDLYWKGYRKQEWISVEERLPHWSAGKVLVFTKYGFSICERTVNSRWQGQHANWITHWMPLPEAPKMKGGEGK